MTPVSMISRRSENLIRSTLKTVAKYDEDTKLGVKVYHLQQLADSHARDAVLSTDDRYIVLKSQVFNSESLSQLSLRQLIAASVALGRLESFSRREWTLMVRQVKERCRRRITQFSPSQISAFLYWIAKSGNSCSVGDRAVVAIFKHLLRNSNLWSGSAIVRLLFFIRQRSAVEHPIFDKFVRQIAYRFNERLGNMSSKEICCALHELSRMKLFPGQTIHRALRLIGNDKFKLDAKTTSLLLVSLASFRVYRHDFLQRLALRITVSDLHRSIELFNMRNICMIGRSFAILGFFHRGLYDAIVNRFVMETEENIKDADLGMLAFTLGRFGVADSEVWERLATLFSRRVDRMSPLNISIIMCAMARCGKVFEDVYTLASNRIAVDSRAYTKRQLVNLSHAFAILGQPFRPELVVDPQTDVEAFQCNLSKLIYRADHDIRFPVMYSLSQSRVHQNIVDFLKTNECSDVLACVPIGALWADAVFTDTHGSQSAILIVGDSDVCKVNAKELLGVPKWRKRYLEALGFRTSVIHRSIASKVQDLWVDENLKHLVRTDAPRVFKRKRRLVLADPLTGKISFRKTA
jgi:hypothetical protein